jgi:hypothetical protein
MISQLIPVINLGIRTFNVIAPSISKPFMFLHLVRLCNLIILSVSLLSVCNVFSDI